MLAVKRHIFQMEMDAAAAGKRFPANALAADSRKSWTSAKYGFKVCVHCVVAQSRQCVILLCVVVCVVG